MPVGPVASNAEEAQRETGQRERKGGQGVFQRKYGPLPGWGWALLAGGSALAYFWWRSRSKAQAGASAAYTGSASGTIQSQLDDLQAEIDALYGQSGTSTVTTGSGGSSGGVPAPPANPPTQPKPPIKPPGPNKWLTAAGQPKAWVQKILHIKTLKWPNRYFTDAGLPRNWVKKKLGG